MKKTFLNILALCFGLSSCSGHYFSASPFNESDQTDQLSAADNEAEASADHRDVASSDELETQSKGGGAKPSDGGEDIGYVRPDIRSNGDLYFETKGLHPEVDLRGFMLAGTYPDDIAIKISVLADDQGVPSLPPASPVIAVSFEDKGAPASFTGDYSIELIERSPSANKGLVVRYEGRVVPIPGPQSNYKFELDRPNFTAWLTDSDQHPRTNFSTMTFRLAYSSVMGRLQFYCTGECLIRGEWMAYDNYDLLLFPADANDSDNVRARAIAKIDLSANDIGTDGVADIQVPRGYVPTIGHSAVVCPLFQGVRGEVCSEAVDLQIEN